MKKWENKFIILISWVWESLDTQSDSYNDFHELTIGDEREEFKRKISVGNENRWPAGGPFKLKSN